jgi:hypothetical protein
MNRVLCWPHTPIFPGLLDGLKIARSKTAVTERGTIRFDVAAGAVEMRFSSPRQQLPAGTRVYVWWKGGGFVCAPAAELDREEREARRLAERLAQARSRLAQARQVRTPCDAAPVDAAPRAETTPLLRLVR